MFSTVEIATSQGIQNHVLQVQMTAKKKESLSTFVKIERPRARLIKPTFSININSDNNRNNHPHE